MVSLSPSSLPVTNDSKKVRAGSTFVAIRGFKLDGTQFIADAIARGATKIISDLPPQDQDALRIRYPHVTFEFVADARKALALSASAAYNNPSSQLKIIGITGTKGKSTTTHLIAHILNTAGKPAALCGGIANRIADHTVPSSLTTPDSDYLHYFFAQCREANMRYVVMEVTAHALSLDRVYGIPFTAVGFSNFAQDHLDFYGTMEAYFAAKQKIFQQLTDEGQVIINTDDDWGKLAFANVKKMASTTLSMGLENADADVLFNIISNDRNGLSIKLNVDGQTHVLNTSFLMGTFNAYNIVLASLVCARLGVSWASIRAGVATFQGTPGRLQLHRLKNGAQAFVDFAHNPSSMESVLKTLRQLTPHLIVVFGCGGDRDKTKRPLMGAAAAQYGDIVIVTDDNPRTEDRLAIIQDICAGIKPSGKEPIVEPDRHLAIQHAATLARPDSIIALLGKGHENYCLIGKEKRHFDDFEEISRY